MSGTGTGDGGQGDGGGATPTRPEFLPETAWDATKGVVNLDVLKGSFDELDALRTFKTGAEKVAADAAATRFAKAEDVPLALPADLKLPDGLRFEFDPKDPMAEGIRGLAVKYGLSKEAVADGVGLIVRAQLAAMEQAKTEQKAANDAIETGFKDFGEGRKARVDAVSTWIDGGPLKEHAADLKPLLRTASGVKVLETIQVALKDAGLRGIAGGAPDNKIDTTGMTPRQMLEAANAASMRK